MGWAGLKPGAAAKSLVYVSNVDDGDPHIGAIIGLMLGYALTESWNQKNLAFNARHSDVGHKYASICCASEYLPLSYILAIIGSQLGGTDLISLADIHL